MKRVPANLRHLDARLMAIRSGHYPNANQLAQTLEVGPRTVQGDSEYLRDQLGVDIGHDAVRHDYFLTDPDAACPGDPFSEAEILSLFVARQALAAHRGTGVEEILSEGFSRLESLLDDQQFHWSSREGHLKPVPSLWESAEHVLLILRLGRLDTTLCSVLDCEEYPEVRA